MLTICDTIMKVGSVIHEKKVSLKKRTISSNSCITFLYDKCHSSILVS